MTIVDCKVIVDYDEMIVDCKVIVDCDVIIVDCDDKWRWVNCATIQPAAAAPSNTQSKLTLAI